MSTPFGLKVAGDVGAQTRAFHAGDGAGAYDTEEQVWVGADDSEAVFCTVRCYSWLCTPPLRFDLTMWC